MNTKNMCIAIAVLSQLSRERYQPNAVAQSGVWTTLREAICHVSNTIEDTASDELDESEYDAMRAKYKAELADEQDESDFEPHRRSYYLARMMESLDYARKAARENAA